MIKLALAILVIIAIFIILQKVLNSGPDKDMQEELRKVKAEAERLDLEEEIARKQSRNRARKEKIDSLGDEEESPEEDLPTYTFD